MRSRQKVNRRIDKRVFTKTARRIKAVNVPGQIVTRGGTRL